MTLFAFDNTYSRDLEQLYAPQEPVPVANPVLVALNRELAHELGLDHERLASPEGVLALAGNRIPSGAQPLAQAYAGHQFGSFNPQLGDGRAVLLGEIITPTGDRRDIALKGSGRTPFSRGGDGRAALGPVLREHLMGEGMHALGIPTTRVLASVATGETVHRDTQLPGAVLTRVASSHLRIGTFQFFASRGRTELVERLVRFAIDRHDPDLAGDERPALALLSAVAERQASLVARWMGVGFIHGVMNTDNMTISGETIDYGPCAVMETYDPSACFSSIDTGGRYAFGHQPTIARWNLARLAEALHPLLDPDPDRATGLAMEVLEEFPHRFEHHWLVGARSKLGLTTSEDDDRQLVADWLDLLSAQHVDHTLAWRRLGSDADLRPMFDDHAPLDDWLDRWYKRSARDAAPSREQSALMRRSNPILIPRNHHVEAALTAAVDDGDVAPFQRLLDAVRRPFDDDPRFTDLTAAAPPAVTARYRTFCGT